MKKENSTALFLSKGAVIAALYVVLTMVLAPLSFGPLQVRVSEMLTILPLFTAAAIPGLVIGCLLANLLGGAVILDVVFGTLATLIGAVLSYALRKNRWLVPLPPVVSNAVIVPFVLRYGYRVELPLLAMACYVALGEVISCYGLGELLATVMLQRKLFFPGRKK